MCFMKLVLFSSFLVRALCNSNKIFISSHYFIYATIAAGPRNSSNYQKKNSYVNSYGTFAHAEITVSIFAIHVASLI